MGAPYVPAKAFGSLVISQSSAEKRVPTTRIHTVLLKKVRSVLVAALPVVRARDMLMTSG
jgi:hypothetical protein